MRKVDASRVGVSLDETVTVDDLKSLASVFDPSLSDEAFMKLFAQQQSAIPAALTRTSPFLTHEIFNKYGRECVVGGE